MHKEDIRLAKQTKNKDILIQLSKHPSSNVRRMVAKNLSTPKEILYRLCEDPVLNVSYLAVHNPNNHKVTKNFGEDADHPCVICTNDEVIFHCTSCIPLKEYRTIS